MQINILTGCPFMGDSIGEYLSHNQHLNLINATLTKLTLGKPDILSRDILLADLWITDVWNPEYPFDPEGFRTVMKLAGTVRVLLIFHAFFSPALPQDGPFWLSLFSTKLLSDKIKEVLSSPPPLNTDFEHLVNLWPLLGTEPLKNHHHRRSH